MTLSHALMEECAKMPWSHIDVHVRKDTLEPVASPQLIGVDLPTPAKMVVAVDRKMPPSCASALAVGQVVFATSQECPVNLLPDGEASRQMSFVTTVDIVSTLETHTTASVPQTLQVVTVSPSLIAVRINLASMVPPAEATWEDTPVTVCLVMKGTTVNKKSTSVSLTHVRMEEPALTLLATISAPVLLGRWGFSVR